MKLTRFLIVFLAIAALGAFVFMATPVFGAPADSPAQQAGSLSNGGFEGSTYMYNNDGDMKFVPQGWTPWWTQSGTKNCNGNPPADFQKPHYEIEQHPTHVHGGIQSARWWTGFAVHRGGLYQTVTATPGSTYKFSAWAFAWSSDDGVVDGQSAGPVDLRVGIDPDGGTNGDGGSVVWGNTLAVVDKFVQLEVQATANGGSITVFMSARPYWCYQRNDSFWDDAALVEISAGPPPAAGTTGGAPPPQPTQQPSSGVPAGSIIPATPQPDGSVVHTVHSGESCIGIAVTYNVSLDDILRLNNLSSCKIITPGQRMIVKGPSGPPPPPTVDPAAPVQPTTDAPTEPPQVAEVRPAIVCVMAYDDQNGNNLPEPTEPKAVGLTINVSGATGVVGTYTTTGAEPYCFNNVTAGVYNVAWTGEGYTPIGEQTWQAVLGEGQTVTHNFAVSSGTGGTTGGLTPEDPTSGPNAEGEGWPLWLTALVGAIGVILFLGGLGVAGYFLLLRRTVR